jgi:hypothetical protein
VDPKLEELIDSVEKAHLATHELQLERANDPVFIGFHRHLWIVRHSLNAARAALVDVGAEASRLRDMGVQL